LVDSFIPENQQNQETYRSQHHVYIP
jgi:hypothetical protein